MPTPQDKKVMVKFDCHEALEATSQFNQENMQAYACDGSAVLVPKQGKQSTIHPPAGWACVNMRTGLIHLGRTTGLPTPARGEWQAILQVLTLSDPSKPLVRILTDYYHAMALTSSYLQQPNRIAKSLHKDLISQCLDIVNARKPTYTKVCWIKGHPGHGLGINGNTIADEYARKATKLPLQTVPPTRPEDWQQIGLPLILPAANRLIQFDRSHKEVITDLHPESIHLHLSALPLLSHPDLAVIKYMHGRACMRSFAFWNQYKNEVFHHVCKQLHPLDLLSAIAFCPKLQICLQGSRSKDSPVVGDCLPGRQT